MLSEQGKASQSHTDSPAQEWGNFLPGKLAPIVVTGNHWDVGLWLPRSSRGVCNLPQQAAMHQGSQPWYPTHHRHPPEDVDAAIPISEEEHVVIVVPGDLIHLKLELFLCFGAMRLRVNEGDNIILVPHCNGLSIRAPTDVDVLP